MKKCACMAKAKPTEESIEFIADHVRYMAFYKPKADCRLHGGAMRIANLLGASVENAERNEKRRAFFKKQRRK